MINSQTMLPELDQPWHALSEAELLRTLQADGQDGLTPEEAQRRIEHYGPNRLRPRKRRSVLVRFLLQFHNPLIYLLLGSAIVTALTKDWRDAIIILGVVLINALIGFLQENRAERAMEVLAEALSVEASVIRAGQAVRLPAHALVPGDLVLLKAGDQVPADLRLLRARDLQVAEAALTGESVAVMKEPGAALAAETGLSDRINLAYTSTLVTNGQGAGLVVATGDRTEIGRISQLIALAPDLVTPLTRKIRRFSETALFGILGLAVVAFIVGVVRGQEVVDTLTAAIALAVAAVPEGLPAALTITLAIGVSRMAAQRAIIRKLPAVETLGSVTIICSDKTGTLTQNQMTVQRLVTVGEHYQLTGAGYDPSGGIWKEHDEAAAPSAAALETLTVGALCNDSHLLRQDGAWAAEGDPTEVALLVSARKAGLREEDLLRQHPRLDAIPFDSAHPYMATLHEHQGRFRVYVKGAAEVLLERSACALTPDGHTQPLERARVHQWVEEMAGQGLRVLAFAYKDLPAQPERLTHDHLMDGLVFTGLQAMIDPPRPEAIAAVQACQNAGIEVKMITGDHARTATAIARQFGMVHDERTPAITGQQLAAMDDPDLARAARGAGVFARVSPEQKLRLVRALQAQGNVVAMTGDGVNDGPALKQADIGIAMGITGTAVAKEAADAVITDDNFATLANAVQEGRRVYDNLTKIIAWTLPTNVGQGLIILLAVLIGAPLPVLPVQILWINLVGTSVLGLVLALEPAEADVMRRPPRPPAAPILTPVLLRRVVLVGLLIMAGAFAIFEYQLMKGAGEAVARTAAVNMVVVLAMAYLFNSRSLSQPALRAGWGSNPWLWLGVTAMLGLQLLFTYAPAFNRFFDSAPISAESWVEIGLAALAAFALVEVEKAISARAAARQRAARQAQ